MAFPNEKEIFAWVVRSGLDSLSEEDLLEGVCTRIVASGLPLFRASVGSDILDPLLDARGFRWQRGAGVTRREFERHPGSWDDSAWTKSPFYHMIENDLTRLRLRLGSGEGIDDFPVMAEMQAEGGRDYIAHRVRFGKGARFGVTDDLHFSWLVDRHEGFSDDELSFLDRLAPLVGLAFILIASIDESRSVLRVYLGSDAADRVLAGNVVRGQADMISGVVWFSDLADFTRLTDSLPHAEVLSLLNDYAACLVEAVEDAHGEVLKFIGDGILAVFRDDDQAKACADALDAATAAKAAIRDLNERRAAEGLPTTEFTLALHVGDLLYGNFGGKRRLDFTVLGPAVNEASRIQALCRQFDRRLIVSAAFAAACGDRRTSLVSLGRYALKGVGRPQELFTLE